MKRRTKNGVDVVSVRLRDKDSDIKLWLSQVSPKKRSDCYRSLLRFAMINDFPIHQYTGGSQSKKMKALV